MLSKLKSFKLQESRFVVRTPFPQRTLRMNYSIRPRLLQTLMLREAKMMPTLIFQVTMRVTSRMDAMRIWAQSLTVEKANFRWLSKTHLDRLYLILRLLIWVG